MPFGSLDMGIPVLGGWTPAKLKPVLWLRPQSATTRTAGQAAQFNAISLRYLSHAGSAALRGQSGTGGWWRSIWFYLDSTAGSKYLQNCLTGGNGYSIYVDATPALNAAANATTVTHGTTLSISTWYHVMVWYDGVNLNVSLNDGAAATAALATYTPGANTWGLGADPFPADYFDGRIQTCCGDDGTLTAAQRTAIYNGGTPLAFDQMPVTISSSGFFFPLNEPSGARSDWGPNALSLTNNNSVGTAAGTALIAVSQWNDLSGYGSNATQSTQALKPTLRLSRFLKFDGTDDVLSAGTAQNLQGLDPLTILAWVYPDATAAGWIVNSGGSGTLANVPYGLRITGARAGAVSIGNDVANNSLTTLNALTLSAWSHLVGVVTSGNLLIYVNGYLDTSVARTINPTAVFSACRIGAADAVGTGAGNARLAEVMIVNRDLSAQEILAHYNATKRFVLAKE